MKLDFKEFGKNVGLPMAGLVLMVVSYIVNGKNSEVKLNDVVEKKIAEALAKKTKES